MRIKIYIIIEYAVKIDIIFKDLGEKNYEKCS